VGSAIGDILPLAIGVAISPVPIIAIVLMLATPRGKANGIAFAIGWVAGLAIVAAIVLLAESGSSSDDSGEPATWTSVVKLAVGVLFVLLGVKQWRGRPKSGEQAELPKWMQTIDTFRAGKSLGLGVLLSALNPKNLGLTLGAALIVAQAGLSVGEEIGVMAVFVAIASASILGPVAIYLIMGSKGKDLLDDLKTWMGVHNAAIMTVLFLVLGLKLVGDAIGGLTS
jgi:threonine/homoserine/homoserine lactone efflux protein